MQHIINHIAKALSLSADSVAATIRLLDDGCTVPFISRYRKEATGSLDEVQIHDIATMLESCRKLDKRRDTVIAAIEAAGRMTPELRDRIMAADSETALEDLYLPYKPQRRTRAQAAVEAGLEPLARIIMAQHEADPERRAARFAGSEAVPDAAAAIDGALDIIAQWINENTRVRDNLRSRVRRYGMITSAPARNKESQAAERYPNYYEFKRPLSRCPSHQYLAMRRGEDEGVLRLAIEIDDNAAVDSIRRMVIRREASPATAGLVGKAADSAYRRLLRPAVDRELASETKTRADAEAISLFADNVRQLLMAPPLKASGVLAIDPGFRTGCKVVCLDPTGALLHHCVIHPVPPHNDREGAAATLTALVERYDISAIALGNGTASRETQAFLRSIGWPRRVDIHIVSESGASIYSASPIARAEMPDQDVTVRGAVSIGRRLIDPLAELVKIEPRSIGVGQYQHDVDQTALREALEFTVSSCVNTVGVNLNTASAPLLSYVSGIGPSLAASIVEHRRAHGPFATRAALLDVPRLGPKAYAMAAGFLRVNGSPCRLDSTAVHPESYPVVERMARSLGTTVDALVGNTALLDSLRPEDLVGPDAGLPTVTDILDELRRPARDPRSEVADEPEFDPTVTDITQLRVGMKLRGIVTNVTDFGAFVDIGVHRNGLLHPSRMPRGRRRLPIGTTLTVTVIDVDLARQRISLSLID